MVKQKVTYVFIANFIIIRQKQLVVGVTYKAVPQKLSSRKHTHTLYMQSAREMIYKRADRPCTLSSTYYSITHVSLSMSATIVVHRGKHLHQCLATYLLAIVMYDCILLLLYCLFTELDLSDTAEKQLPELDALETFYEKICSTLPTDLLMPNLITQRVISINDRTKIDATFKTEFERAQHLIDHHIARPLSTGDPRFFNILLDFMSTSSKCRFLVSEIQQYLSTTLKHPKFSI